MRYAYTMLLLTYWWCEWAMIPCIVSSESAGLLGHCLSSWYPYTLSVLPCQEDSARPTPFEVVIQNRLNVRRVVRIILESNIYMCSDLYTKFTIVSSNLADFNFLPHRGSCTCTPDALLCLSPCLACHGILPFLPLAAVLLSPSLPV
jgi:hypothetical protein